MFEARRAGVAFCKAYGVAGVGRLQLAIEDIVFLYRRRANRCACDRRYFRVPVVQLYQAAHVGAFKAAAAIDARNSRGGHCDRPGTPTRGQGSVRRVGIEERASLKIDIRYRPGRVRSACNFADRLFGVDDIHNIARLCKLQRS